MMKNLSKVIVLMLVLVLACSMGTAAYAAVAGSATELPLTDEWAKPTVTFTDALGNPYPEGYEFKDGDSVRFRIDLNLTGSNMWYGWGYFTTPCQHAIREAYFQGWTYGEQTDLPQIDENTEFTIPFSDVDYLKLGTNMPTSKATANTAYDGSLPVFKWWIDEATGTIRITFTKDALESRKKIRSAFVAVSGTLDLSKAENEDNIHFDVDDSDFDLPLATKYTLQKSAALVQEDSPAKNYKAQYTLKMTVDKDQDLSSSPLKITDVSGAFIGDPEKPTIKVTTTSGDNVAVEYKDGAFVFSSNDQVLKAGEYTITYTSPLKDWNKDQLEGDDGSSFNSADASNRKNTAEIVKNEKPTGVKAEATINYTPLKDQVKVDKNNDNTGKTTLNNIYVENGNYYIDYYIDVTLKNDAKEFVVSDDGGEWLQHVAENPTLQHAAGAWDWVDSNSFSASNAGISYSDNGGVRTFTVKGNPDLKAGAYRIKYRMQVKSDAIDKVLDEGRDVSLINTAKTISVDGRGVEVVDSQHNAVPTYKNTSKYGSVETITQADGTEVKVVKWTATYQWNFFQNGGGKVTDTITGGKLYIDSEHPFVIKNGGNQIASLGSASDTANGLTLGETGFTYELGKLNENTANEYVLTYYTVANVTDESTGATTDTVNTIGVDYDGDGDDDGKGTGTVNGSTGEGEDPEDPNPPVDPSVPTPKEMNITKAGKVIKTDATNKQVTVEWTASVALQEVPYADLTKFEIVDTLKPDWGKTMTFTAAPVVTVTKEDDSVVTLTANVDYTVETSADGLTQKVVLFMDSVRAKADTAKSVNVVYTSLCSAEENNNFKNHAVTNYKYGSFDEQTDSTDASVDQQLLLSSKSGYLNYGNHDFYNASNGNYGWPTQDGVDDYPYQFKLRDANFINRGVETPITLKEILPTLNIGGSSVRVFNVVPGSLRISSNELINSWGSRNITDYTYTSSSSGFDLAFNLPADWASDTVYVYFACVPTDAYWALVKGDVYMHEWTYGAVTNTGIVSWDGQDQTLKDTQSFTIVDNRLNKTSSLVASDGGYSQINYTIRVNPQALDLVSDSDTVTLTDHFSEGASSVTYVQSSFVVKDANGNVLERGASASENSYYLVFADDGKSFEITLPDSKGLTISYYAWPTVAAGQQTGNISNNASLVGVNKNNTINSFTASLPSEGVSTTLTGSNRGVYIQKKETGTELPLDDAEFTVYTVSTQAGATEEETGVLLTPTDKIEYSSNGLAMVTFSKDELNHVYAIKETKAPEGYTASDDVWYFYFDQTDEDGNIVPPTEEMQAVIDVLGGHVTHTDKALNYTFSAYNEKLAHTPTTATLDLSKKLTITGGTLPADETFTFELANTAAYETYDASNTAANVTKTTGFAIKNVNTTVTFASGLSEETTQTSSSAMGSTFLPFEIEFTEPGTYVFTLKEKTPAAPSAGITYDTTEYEIWYTVTADEEDKLTAARKVYKNSAETSETPIFENTYTSTSVSDSLDVTKFFYDRTNEKTWGTCKDTQSFSFTLEADAATAALLEADDDCYAIVDGAETITLNLADAKQHVAEEFKNVFTITFTAPGAYTFLVKETDENASNPAILYDKTVYEVKYTVADDMTITRTFNVQGSDEKESFIIFENALNTLDFSIPFHKDFKDFYKKFKDFDADDTITAEFELEKVDSTGEPIEGKSAYSSTATASYTGYSGISFNFKNIPFSYDDVGSYLYFKVSEIIPEDAAADIVYDDVPVWVRAEVMMSGTTIFANLQYCKGEEMPESEEAWSDNANRFTNIALDSITVHKAWNPQPEIIPDLSSSLTLYARTSDGAGNVTDTPINVAPVYDSEAGSYTWNNLPFTDANGNEISYIVKETAVPDGYTVSYTPVSVGEGDETQPVEKDFAFDGEIITNTLNTVDISGTKHWADGNADHRPIFSEVSLEVYVYNGTTETKLDPQPTVEWTSATGSNMGTDWTWTVKGLAPLPEGSEYRMREVFVGESAENNESMFSASYENEKDYAVSGGTITNTLTTGTFVTKYWDDGLGIDAERPTDIFDLYGYTSDINVENVTAENASVVLLKKEPTSIEKYVDVYGVTVWTVYWEGLPAFDANGNTLYYRVVENRATSPEFPYVSTVNSYGEITNTLWHGVYNPYAIKFLDGQQLENNGAFSFVLKDVTDPANPKVLETVQANRYGDVSFSVIEYGPDALGKTYHYQMSEVLPSDATAENGYVSGGVKYDTTIYDVKIEIGEDGTVKKSYKTSTESDYVTDPEPSDDPNAEIEEYTIVFYNETLTSITVYKAWKPYLDNAPDVSGYLTLYARTTDSEGNVTDTAVKGVAPAYDSEAGTYTWNNLPKSDADGSKITYIVKEEGLPGYIATYPNGWDYVRDGMTITNTLAKAELPIEKNLQMVGYGDIPTTPPEYAKSFSFTITPAYIPEGESVKLLQGNTELTPNADGSYNVTIDMTSAELNSYQFSNTLPLSFEFSNFGIYYFTISEVIPSDASDHMVYDDALRAVTFYVTQNGVTAMDANLTYTKDSVNLYPVSFTNRLHAPVNLELIKVWTDGIPEGFEPEDLKLQLFYAERKTDDNGNIVYPSNLSGFTRYSKAAPVVTADPNDPTVWTITCDNLPDHINGKPVIWAIAEISVPDGYTAIYENTSDGNEKNYALDGESIENAPNIAEGEFTLIKRLDFSAPAENLEDTYAYSFSLMPDPEADPNAALDASAYTVSGMNPVMNDGALSHYETMLAVGKEDAYTADHTVSFTFSKEGTYVFKVAEIIPDDIPDGFRYDITEYAVTFNVSKDASTGRLTADLTVPKDGYREFVNYYSETEGFAGKLWKGGMPESTDGFEDYLTLEYAVLQFDVPFDTLDWKPYESSDVAFTIIEQPLPDEEMSEIESLYGEGLQPTVWIILAEHLPRFIDGKEVIYLIREKDLPGYTASYDDETGTIINTLKKVSSSFTIEKHINAGDEETLPMDTFSFILTADGNNPAGCTAPASPITLTVTDNGEVYTAQQQLDFTFTEAGTYVFTLEEQIPNPYPDGWVYDETTLTLTFEVSEDMTVKTLVDEGNGFYSADSYVFLNWYYGYTILPLFKTWMNDSPSDRPAPEALGLTLEYRLTTGYTEDGEPIYSEWAPYTGKLDIAYADTDTDTWLITYSALPEMINGKLAEYSVRETTVPDGYVATYENGLGYAGYGDTITNTLRKTSATLGGMKILTGREFRPGDSFTFDLYAESTTTEPIDTVTITPESGNQIAFSFKELTYGAPDTYLYYVKERGGEIGGVTYDETEYTVVVKVTEVADESGRLTGAIEAEVTYPEDGVVFANTYEAYAELAFGGTKRFTDANGDRSLEGQSFFIDRIEQKLVDGKVVKELTDTVPVNEDGSFTFDSRPFTQDAVGTYVYTIREMIPEEANENGVIYDKTEYTFTLTVSDNGDGTLTLVTDEGYLKDGFDFTNTYEAEGSVTLYGLKFLENKDIEADDFSFQLMDESGKVLQTVQNDEFGEFAFDIQYGLGDLGRHVYTVSEVIPEGVQDGVTYDKNIKTVTVNVTDNGTGTLTTEIAEESDEITFTNTYNAVGLVTFEGTKTMVGRDFTEGDTFTFVRTQITDEGETVLDSVTVTPNEGESVSFKFEDLTYTLEDAGKTFTYTVKEADTGIDGVIYATTIHEVSYTVVDMGDGKLGLQMLKGDIEALNFTNTYAAEGEVRFAGTKSLTGKALEADAFAFQLKDESGDVIQIVTNDAKGSFAFDAIKYDLDDAGKTFTYTISEVIPEDAENGVLYGVTYDNTVHTVTVEVIDNGDGKLTVKASDNASAITFANTYAAEGEFKLSGSKAMSGRTFREGDEFTFELVESGEVIDTVTVKPTTGRVADFSFEKIALTLEDVGKKTYTVREVKGNISGVTYDTAEKQVTVVITDSGSGKLSTEITEESDDVLFTNTYEAGNSVAFSGSKTLNGKTAEADAFSFVLKDAQGDVIETVKNGADGTFAFSAINYTLADVDKTFTYTVSEVNDGKAGYTYDDTVYTVTVEVADLGTGALQLTVSANYESLDFANTYAATGSVSFSGSKALTGKALEENEFSFVLSDENGEIETVTNGADGTFAFSAIEYDLDDAGKTFTYTVSEVNDGKAGVTYDETVYTVTVDVTDNGDGTLKTVVSDNADALDFANAYAADGSVTFSGSKKMTGRSFIKGDEFTFELVESGEVIDTATIKPTTGSVSGFFFKPIAYTLDDLGEHVYTVREKNTGIAGVTYDETIYTVTVTVADAGEGKLSVEATENAKKLTFTNAYKAIGSASFSGTKTLAGKALRADDFGFVLKDEAGETLQAVTNAADGRFSFDEIAYTEADAGKTFTYTISELAGSMAGVTYDKTVHTVTVEVTDNGDGTLTAKTSANAQALDFTNTYAADGSVVFSGNKTLTGKTLDAETFYFILTDAEGNEIETVTHDENGAFTFTKLTYGLEDAGKTFTYKVREIDSGMAGVTYDKNEYVITVEVVDNGDGTLAAKASANAQALDFTNVYTAKGAVSFSGSKTMVGRELEAGDFAFNLIDEDGVILETVVNEADGRFSFEEIAYTLEDAGKTFTYTVREENDEEPGVTYDDTVYTVTVKVTDNGDGTLKTETSENAAKLNFVNTYAADGSVVFTGTKILEGRELEAGEFSFVLMDENGETLQTATHDETGFFAFEPIKYDLTDAGKTYTYTYKVAEKAGDAAGVTYDDTVHTVTVAVTDNGDGTLTVKPSSNANKLTFTNTYEAKGVVTFSGSKTMTGREFAEGDSFTFELVENGKVIDTAVITPTEGSSEAFSFKEITYTAADLGKHSYTVREAKGELGGVTYDETTYTIDVNVTDNGDGTLAMAVSPCYNALDFTNAYSAKGAYQIAGRKVYEGGELTGEDFTFVLRTQSGNVIEEIDNDETGAFAFSELAYDLDDAGKTFTYTVSEVNTAIRGVTYDETVYTVAVTVTDNGDGTLKTDAAVTAGEAAVSEIVFTNTFSASLTISKTVEGEETENTFPMTIRLYDAEGSELTGSYAYEGDLTGTMKSGDVIRLGHSQSVTISSLPVGTNYTVAEEANNAYETTVNGLGGSETDGEITAEGAAVEFVNERKLTSFSVTKRWEGGSGPIELTLYANGVKLDPQPVCTGHDDVYTFENLPMYTDDGEYITYYAKERYVDGYVTIYVNVDPHSGETSVIYDGGTIINRPAKQLSFKVKKVWTGLDEGEKTPEITLTLYCNGEKTNYKTPKPDKNGWYKYYDLPTTVNGKPAVYTVKEEPISGFQVFYQTADGETAEYANNGGQITNAKFPKTGDDSSLALWVALMGGCAALLALLLRRRKA